MKRYSIYTIAVSVMLLLFGSCESWLELNPHDELAYDDAFATAEDAEIAIRGVYYTMHSNTGYYDGQHLIVPDVMTDNLILCSEGRLTMDLLQNWDIKPGNFYVGRAWAMPYTVINRANQVLMRTDEMVPEDEDDQALLNHVRGEAFAIRAMAHFDLVRYFGKAYTDATAEDLGVPYITDPTPSLPSRNTVQDVYTNILADLNQAVTLMSNGAQADGNIRFTVAAANAMLARVYLTMGDWSNAISAATAVIDDPALEVCPIGEFQNVWIDAAEDGVIFKVRITETDVTAAETAGSTIGTYYNQSVGNEVKSEHVVNYEFSQLFAANDIRTAAYISQSVYNGKLFNHIFKYKGVIGSPNPDLVDAKVLRVAEMYLIRAEASMKLATPDEATALSDLNTLRAERYEPFTDGTETGAALLNAIMLERRLELAFEGHRWFDLKRLGLPVVREDNGDEADGNGLPYRQLVLPAGDDAWIFPIPTTEADANPNI